MLNIVSILYNYSNNRFSNKTSNFQHREPQLDKRIWMDIRGVILAIIRKASGKVRRINYS